jgi:predicted O-linked N-acetylglucosamine transferase (SPINDLY family)
MGDARNTLGVVLAGQARHDEALAEFRAAVRLAPRSAEALNNLSNALSQAGRHDEALPVLQEVLALDPQLAEAHYNLATVLQVLKRHDEAAAALRRVLELAPRMSYALGYLVWNRLAVCRWHGLEAEIEALRAQVCEEGIAAEPFAFLAVSASPEEQQSCGRAHAREQHVTGTPSARSGRQHKHSGRERIRLAYLSADYCEHATAYLAAGLFERHDRRAFEVIGISYGADDGSPMRHRLERAFDRFVDVRAHGDEEAARLLRELEVDIAVDLKGYTTGARPGILAQRAAPVQAAWLGYPGTLGAAGIDYLIADRTVVPEGAERFYDEQVVFLPDCYQVNDSGRAIAEHAASRAGAGLPEDGFVFCCFNNSYKIAPSVFTLWMRLLAAVPGSVLWLLQDSAAAAENLRGAACAAGIDPARLVFAGRLPHAEHLARHRVADLFLDTLPYNAHTTASDALWAGLPVLTCAGTTFAGRVGASLLRAVGLSELITSTSDEYMTLALELARDRSRLGAVRAKLARNRAAAPLFDTERFRRGLESAYRTMWQACTRGEPPRSFAVEAQP